MLIDIPVTASLAEVTYRRRRRPDLPGYKPTIRGHAKQIRSAAEAINEAERPVIYVGGGVIAASAALNCGVAELRRLPVTTTLHGPRRLPRDGTELARHARHARHRERATTRSTRATC